MKYTIKHTSRFKKDFKLAVRRGLEISRLTALVDMLAEGVSLPATYNDHPLTGRWVNHRECHIQPDWLLVYYYSEDVLVLTLVRTGTHSDLFGK